MCFFFFFQAEDGIRDHCVTGVQTCALPISLKGTARAAQLEGYTAAGKTGTAQKIDPKTRAYSHTKYVASFVGFAPIENPAVVIIVVIDEAVGLHQGGQVAAPVFREIANQVLP